MPDHEPDEAHDIQGVAHVARELINRLVAICLPLALQFPSHLRREEVREGTRRHRNRRHDRQINLRQTYQALVLIEQQRVVNPVLGRRNQA